jgi:glycerol-1-phosphate dehydrogenase [NAD(P)+]
METMIERINRISGNCDCESHNKITLDEVVVEAGALAGIPSYLKKRGYKHIALIADTNTFRAAGLAVQTLLKEAEIDCGLVYAKPNEIGDVVADEQTIVGVMLEIQPERTDLIVAVGSGTIHDIVRFIAYKMNKPFLSVPTAPSVDGFTSKGAPIIIRGEKITIPASSPVAIFADLDLLSEAPGSLVAAGFGDMLGKFTSLFDWKFGRLTAGEPYCSAADEITATALRSCVDNVDTIGRLEPEGIRVLMNALIESGMAMLIFGQSHPASGAEHHLSHYWEMEYLRLGRNQLLHGAKVGTACAEISRLYHRIADEELLPGLADWPEINELIGEIPAAAQLRALLVTAGGPAAPAQLGVSDELLIRSLNEAHHVRRNRHTLLKAYNERA